MAIEKPWTHSSKNLTHCDKTVFGRVFCVYVEEIQAEEGGKKIVETWQADKEREEREIS